MDRTGIYTFPVKGSDYDYKGQVSYPTLVDMMLEAAGLHATERGFGLADIMRNGRSWVLTRFHLDLLKSSKYDREIKIETWVANVGELFTNRKFKLYNGKGEIFAVGSSSWALIDIRLRKAIELDGVLDESLAETDKGTDIPAPIRIDSVKEGSALGSVEVKYGDLDINRHVNSVRYIRWVLDCFPLEHFLSSRIKSLDVNYVAEVLYGQKADIFASGDVSVSNENIIELKVDEKAVCRAKVVWE
ncbi:acyl-[acyl-carrier-protein] thioesterase [Fulvitalea axinellae]